MGIGWQIMLVIGLVVLNAVFAGSELALVSLREGQLRRLEQRGGAGAAVAALARDPNRFLATIQIGITLAGFLASATAAVTLAEPLLEPLGFLGGAARPAAVLLVTAGLTFVTLVVGELAPKRVAMQHAEGWSLVVARPLLGLARLARPVVWLLGASTDLVVRLVGGDPSRGREEVTAEEIRDMVAAQGLYSREERRIITGALEATDRVLREVLRPRPVVLLLAEALPVDQAVRRLVEAGHTRAPVYGTELDDTDRVVSLLDLVGRSGTVADHARSAPAMPESVPLVDALRKLQAQRQSMALVVDEYGSFEGIVTVEDLVEELVGEIHDEYDRDVREVVRLPDGGIRVVGHFPIHDLVDVGVDLPQGEYVTVAGLVHDQLQRMPEEGDSLVVEGWRVTVESVRERAVERLTIVPAGTPDEAGTDDGAEPGG